jgi:hypothetical protein
MYYSKRGISPRNVSKAPRTYVVRLVVFRLEILVDLLLDTVLKIGGALAENSFRGAFDIEGERPVLVRFVELYAEGRLVLLRGKRRNTYDRHCPFVRRVEGNCL